MKNKSFMIALALSIIAGIAEIIYFTKSELTGGWSWRDLFVTLFFVGIGKLWMFGFIYTPKFLLGMTATKSDVINIVIPEILGIVTAVPCAIYMINNEIDLYFFILNCLPWTAAFIMFLISYLILIKISEKRKKQE